MAAMREGHANITQCSPKCRRSDINKIAGNYGDSALYSIHRFGHARRCQRERDASI